MSGIAFNVLWVVCVLLLLLALYLAIRRRRLAQRQAVRARQQVYGYNPTAQPERTTQFYGSPSHHVVSPGPSRAHDLEMGNVQAPPPVYKPEDAPPPAYQDYRKDIPVQPSTSS
ncbi:hypothetical protein BCR43DRAFT_483602 [Syncephalastrum racemosum]|uniref:Uncharacterized protein n=1 Tax=Syncephalastrum racemosum TaxID=13706 RepID=A0A1X2HVK5_SYNRA|nr:hypothetical protein BCR43DRAFT_483602 [Syncephalastrum racemosum]